jgi:hypothetical protein
MIILVNQEKLTKTERVKLYVTLSNYIFHKTKYIRGKFTLEQLREQNRKSFQTGSRSYQVNNDH